MIHFKKYEGEFADYPLCSKGPAYCAKAEEVTCPDCLACLPRDEMRSRERCRDISEAAFVFLPIVAGILYCLVGSL